MGIHVISMCAILAIIPLYWLPVLPDLHIVWLLIAAGVALSVQKRKWLRFSGLALLFMCWGILAAQESVWPMNHLTKAPQQAEVVITATDGATMHQGRIISLNGERVWAAMGVSLYGNYLPQNVCVGQRWAMTLRLRAVHGELNDGGYDSQKNAFARHQTLSGRFTHAEIIDARCSLRSQYLTSLQNTLSAYQWGPVILGLGMGERLSVSREIKNLMRETGTMHLMAISGLHIALAASVIWFLARGIQFFLPGRWIIWQIPLLAGLLFAAFYAWLTGLQPPALRTVMALVVLAALKMSGRQWSPWQVWLTCVAAILFFDPLAVLSQSLALSAFAVAALIFWYQWLPLPHWQRGRCLRPLVTLLYLQVGMLLLLLPLQVLIFHGFSLSSLVANLFAVPLVTFISVPLILLGMFLHLFPVATLESIVWLAADKSLAGLFWLLMRLPNGWQDVDERWQCLTLLPWLLIIGWRFRAFSAVPAVCLAGSVVMAFPLWHRIKTDSWSLHMLDVGQGLAMVIERHGKAILYDTGLAWPGGDSAQQLIIPWLRWHHLRPEGVILSHEHLDHAGGLTSLKAAWPAMWIRSPLAWTGHLPCFRGQRWQWHGLTFSVHWPPENTPEKGNNRSCVVKIDDGEQSVLLTGDIEAQAELAMLSHRWRQLAATLIQVPNHGSNTSSSTPLLQRVEGQVSLASMARYNAWRFPSIKVVRHYRTEGYLWLDTPQSGQITVTFSHQSRQIRRLREHYLPRWYHQWFGAPVDNG
ncbi:competence protein ComEC [Enterobacter cloacae]|uniref:ComEC family protein n=2 Tax=Enterobacter TaxID=547 RepID=UPI0004F7D780|nr:MULTISPECIES: ComEC family protein [Enterobacter cloacae complex]AIX58614.1 competence protein ComEC [Enterobacter cloacae]EKS6637992.1 ComEC family protein [Enterobacter hormaechei]AIN22157.1 competence protein ComEC [Enterobacter hormaechei subsp. hoffmannii ECNIH3]AIN27500.1 competence protein ComEC [Enterobacter hormaechei subsp. hoffmannii ECR091]ELD2066695.1 ComEC family protein [Enterobacter hormaechei]